MGRYGRPKLANAERRTATALLIRLNEEEHRVIEAKARAAGVTMTEWARYAAMERDPPAKKIIPELNRKAWLELSRLAATLNGAIRQQRPDISKPVHHASLSAAPGEKLTIEQWRGIAEKYIEGMGFGKAPYVVVQHRDTDLDHIHIVASRVDLEGKVVSEWRNKRRSEKIMREIEREYGLQQVAPSRAVQRAAPKRGEIEMFNQTGKLSSKMTMQASVERALKDSPTVTEFIERLEKVGVSVIPHLQSTGRVSGISFRQDGELMKGSNLGRGFSWAGLQKRGQDYDSERDREAIEGAWKRGNADRSDEPAFAPESQRSHLRETLQTIGEATGRSRWRRENREG